MKHMWSFKYVYYLILTIKGMKLKMYLCSSKLGKGKRKSITKCKERGNNKNETKH